MGSPRALFVVIAFALALWWYSRRRKSTAPQPVSVPTSPPGPGAGAAAPSLNRAPPPERDVAGTVSDGEGDILQDNGNNTRVAGPGGWQQNFYLQMWLPASRLRLSELRKEDWIYAMTFLQNGGREFTRRDDLGDLGAALIQLANDTQGGVAFTQTISAVASIVPVIGPLLSKVNAIQTSELQGGAAWETAMGNGTLGALFKSSLSDDTPQTRHLMANYTDQWSGTHPGYALNSIELNDGPEAPLDRRVMTLPEILSLFPAQNFSPPQASWAAVDDFGNPVHFNPRMRLFTKYEGGWFLPWLCWHFNGDLTESYPLRKTINARARIYRAVDALIAARLPWIREDFAPGYVADKSTADSFPPPEYAGAPRGVNKNLYFYVSPLLGPVLGSIFPPTDEDVRYVGQDGRLYSFWGEPMTGIPAGAYGPADDSSVDPAVKAGRVRSIPRQLGVVNVPVAQGSTGIVNRVGLLPPPSDPTIGSTGGAGVVNRAGGFFF